MLLEKNVEKPRAVVDTNLIVSGVFAKTSSTPAKLIDAWREGKYIFVTSVPILEEIQDVLSRDSIRKHFLLSDALVDELIEELSVRAFIVPGNVKFDLIQDDPDDNIILEAAIEGLATYIVTGDKKHLLPLKEYEDIGIVTAQYFLSIL